MILLISSCRNASVRAGRQAGHQGYVGYGGGRARNTLDCRQSATWSHPHSAEEI